MQSLPIADYALLSDCHSAALVSSQGSIDWLCLPDFDSPSVFGRLLDSAAGHWSIRAQGVIHTSRSYLDATMTMRTVFETANGRVELLDALAMGERERGHDLGRGSPNCLMRSVKCTTGEVDVDLEFEPRPEYGLVLPLLILKNGGVLLRGGAAQYFLSISVPINVTEGSLRTTFRLAVGESAHFSLQYASALDESPSVWSQSKIADRFTDTIQAWRSWSEIHQNYDGPFKEMVAHSGRVLQALTYYPSGAIVAAPTTSLPEAIGGNRNWDYRFTWVRDASFTLEALWVAACPEEAGKFLTFLAQAALTQLRQGADLQIMFGIRGERDLTERTLAHLSGWKGSSPVRVGNGAWNQRQLDVYGELLGAVFALKEHLASIDDITRDFLVAAVDTAAARWEQTDQGIWEIRGEPRHFLYSKLMCWVALDRGIRLAPLLKAEDKTPAWRAQAGRIRDRILSDGWSEKAAAFSQTFGSDELDASALMIPIVGFLPGSDPRVLSTLDAIATRLTDEHGLVYRYLSTDGLAGKEGSFLFCTFWLAHAQALAGQIDRAKATFMLAMSFANDVGLLSEEVLPESRELLGNFPQAFSHIGLINAAWAIANHDAGPTQKIAMTQSMRLNQG
jgi:alpha,alpha-trehalase